MIVTSVLFTIVRILVGLIFIGHGAQKLFGWFGGGGIAGTAGFMESLGVRPGRFWAVMSGLGEFVGGALLVLGFLTPVGAAIIIAVMAVAIAQVHAERGLWNTQGGAEYNLVVIGAMVLFGLMPPTIYSVDYYTGYLGIPQATLFYGSVAVMMLGAAASTLGGVAVEEEELRTRTS
jgi:putative oxidoreductase